jgi:hypothetical protein
MSPITSRRESAPAYGLGPFLALKPVRAMTGAIRLLGKSSPPVMLAAGSQCGRLPLSWQGLKQLHFSANQTLGYRAPREV